MRSWTASLADVRAQITTMRTLAAESDAVRARVAPRVSAWSTTHHLDHCVKVATTVLEAIREGAPVGRRISVLGRLILQFGWIPRGRGKSPKRVFGDAVSGAGLHDSALGFARACCPASVLWRPFRRTGAPIHRRAHAASPPDRGRHRARDAKLSRPSSALRAPSPRKRGEGLPAAGLREASVHFPFAPLGERTRLNL
ncbi:MAG: hypothetical protein M3Q69_02260 [Acidobacteriota bacterium]|nr:hypothetical protein [Acidobacteriota bacterium]